MEVCLIMTLLIHLIQYFLMDTVPSGFQIGVIVNCNLKS